MICVLKVILWAVILLTSFFVLLKGSVGATTTLAEGMILVGASTLNLAAGAVGSGRGRKLLPGVDDCVRGRHLTLTRRHLNNS